MADDDAPRRFDERVAQHQRSYFKPDPLSTVPTDWEHSADGDLPNTPLGIASVAFALGIVFSVGAYLCLQGLPLAQAGFFAAAWAVFHFSEFAVTAAFNRPKLSIDSFLLNNGKEYHYAHAAALLEWTLGTIFWPRWKLLPYVSLAGIALTLVGQALRSAAMITATTNFSHQVMARRKPGHQLVTTGVYAWSRHPSYAGFFYWGLGTQVVLQNPVMFCTYAAILWRFFGNRIKWEEQYLVNFFGESYVTYRKRVGTGIPFMR